MTKALVRLERTRAVVVERGELRATLGKRVGDRHQLRRWPAVTLLSVPVCKKVQRDPEEIV